MVLESPLRDEVPRRDEVLRAVIAAADQRLDGVLPMDVAGAQQVFREPANLVGVLHVRWSATLGAQVDRALAELPDDPERAVVRGWRRTARELPGVRMVLDGWRLAATGPDLARLERREARQRQWLAVRAGVAEPRRALDEAAVTAGAALEAAGRRYFEPHARPPRRTLVQLIRSALVA